MRTCEACGRESRDNDYCEWCYEPIDKGLTVAEFEVYFNPDVFTGRPREIPFTDLGIDQNLL